MKLALFALSLITLPVMAATTTISASSLVNMLVWIIVIGLIFGLLWWLIGYAALPEPFAKVAKVILALVAVLILINFLLGFAGAPIVSFGR
jgi:uncharacterized membrane protein